MDKSKRIDNVLKALSSELRRNIIYLLAEKGGLRYVDLMEILGIPPNSKSGWFAYHLKTLISSGLVKKEDNGEGVYQLTEVGRKAYHLLKTIESENYLPKGTFGLLPKLTPVNQIKAIWANGLFFYGILNIIGFKRDAFDLLVFQYIGLILLVISLILYVDLVLEIRDVSFILLLNYNWIFLRPMGWKISLANNFLIITSAIFYAISMVSGNLLMLLISITLLSISAILSIIMYSRREYV